jgi:hypothetical protein
VSMSYFKSVVKHPLPFMTWKKTGFSIIFNRNCDKNVISKDCNKMFIVEIYVSV